MMAMSSLAWVVHAAEPPDAAAAAVVTAIDGLAEIHKNNGTAWEKAKPGDRLSIGDAIRTSKSSKATIKACSSSATLLPDTELRITGDCRMHVDRGRIWETTSRRAVG